MAAPRSSAAASSWQRCATVAGVLLASAAPVLAQSTSASPVYV